MARKKSTKPPKLEVVKLRKPEGPKIKITAPDLPKPEPIIIKPAEKPIDLLKAPPVKVSFPKELPPPEGINSLELTAYIALAFIAGSIFTMLLMQISPP